MRKLLVILLMTAFYLGASVSAYASDWDKAGKVLTGIEGIRIFTGGKVDLIGSLFGMNKQTDYRNRKYRNYGQYKKHHRHHLAKGYTCSERVWVPRYTWKREFIPRHEEYSGEFGQIIVEGHYIKYKTQNGGYWETKYYCN